MNQENQPKSKPFEKILNKVLDSITKINIHFLYIATLLVISSMVFFSNYSNPAAPIWDEVYYVSSSEKYTTKTMFMESHPPLAKMIISLGDQILRPNSENPSWIAKTLCPEVAERINSGGKKSIYTYSFTETDSIKSFPEGYSFCGVRFMPLVFAVMLSALFYICFYLLTRNPHIAIFFSTFYIFDNLLVTQFRAAMLDSIQLFWIMGCFALFIYFINIIIPHYSKLNKTQALQTINQKGSESIEKLDSKISSEENQTLESDSKNLENKNSNTKDESSDSYDLYVTKSKSQSSISKPKTAFNPLKLDSWKGLTANLDYKHTVIIYYLFLGIVSGLAAVTKHNSLVILMLPVLSVIWELFTNRVGLYAIFNFEDRLIKVNQKNIRKNLNSLLSVAHRAVTYTIALFLTYFLVFTVHITSGHSVNPKSDNNAGWYKASDQYRDFVQNGSKTTGKKDLSAWVLEFQPYTFVIQSKKKDKKTGVETDNTKTFNFPLNMIGIALLDNVRFGSEYHEGVPPLDMCKKDDNGNLTENGSYALTWPFMNRTISYRWEWGSKDQRSLIQKISQPNVELPKPTDNTYLKYIYLVGNPVIWLISLIVVILSISMLLSVIFFEQKIKNKTTFWQIVSLLSIYLAYMLTLSGVDRVMYLYHYIFPLSVTFLIAALLFRYMFENWFVQENVDYNSKESDLEPKFQLEFLNSLENRQQVLYSATFVVFTLIFASFIFYSPFTYYQPLSAAEFDMRNLFEFWGMRRAN